ncbi:FadR/GntR family transcriptional regulator [Oceanobacillus manasiensis]|uniref:FadR/GntR family transcriptional regulator n=1 Tax=Oceanobacillus manasiensis TaxID=586413 RepID=UPI001E317961|nr:FadR/GntR family transcriptional regulator [Oceanobacillus manasiensis]
MAKEIKSYIKEHNLESGDKLPTVSEWMEILRVGRSTLREGVKKLETEGVVEVKNGKGIYVKKDKAFSIYTSFHVTDGAKHLMEILEVRTALEEKAVKLAAKHATEEQLEEMQFYLDKYVKYRKSKEFVKASEADSNFHRVIYKASNNHILYEIITTIHEELYVLWESPFGKEQLYDESYPYHLKLLEGLREKDKDKSISAFQALIDSVRKNILKLNKE